jgi:NADH-quinone oxidoreductase subunit J
MFRGLEVREIRTPWAPVISLLAAVAFFSVLVLSTSSIAISAPPSPDLQTLGERMISQYWFPAIVLIVGLLTTMIEAIALARRD